MLRLPYTSDTPHYEQVPEGWCITNIGDLLINRDGERKPISSAIRSKQVNKIYDYYGAAGVIDKVDDYIFDERLLLIGEDGANLLSRSKDNAFFAEGKYWVNNHAHVLDATDKFILDYVAIVINAMKLDDYVTGSAQPKLSQDNLNKIPIYLPPLEEQKRILVEINRLFDLIYKLELGKADLATIVKQTKSKILDLAIHGKLVPQNPADEPASELLKRINPNAKITCDNGQYGKMPNGWIISSYKNIVKNISSKPFQILQSEIKDKGLYPVISQSCNYIEGFTDSAEKLFQSQESIIFGDHTRNVKYLNFPFVVGADGVKILQTEACCKYIYYFTIFAANNFIQDKGYSRHYGQLSSISVAIPPLAEQHRIVAKIEELFSSLDNIQKALEV